MIEHYIQVQIDVQIGCKRTQIIVLNEYRTVVRGVLFDTYKRNPSLSPLVMQINDLAAAGLVEAYHDVSSVLPQVFVFTYILRIIRINISLV